MSQQHVLFLRKGLTAICWVMFICLVCGQVHPAAVSKKKVLCVSVTKGFRHSSIPLGEELIKDLGTDSGEWDVDYVRTDEEMAQKMTASALKQYDAVIFNNTSGDLPLPDPQGFIDWVKAGGNVVGIHAATDTFRERPDSPGWAEYRKMMGAQFIGHGPQSEVELLVQDRKHPATKDLPPSFKVTEEIYLFKDWSRDDIRVLIALDKHPNTGEPGDFPISWVHQYGKGRVFYTALGHREDLMRTENYEKHLRGGIRWALGLAKGDASPLPPPSPVTNKEKKQGFRPLFNARDLAGWHVRTEGRTPWTVQNGMLVMGKGGSDLITDEKFGDFILRYDYMIPKGGNSGVYLRGRYEIQILDDFETKQPDIHGNGSVYGLIAPSQFASRPAGEWQSVEAKLVGKNLTVVLNGIKIIDNQPLPGPTAGALDDKVDEPGPIMLQGDHGPVAYRNIRIKPLK